MVLIWPFVTLFYFNLLQQFGSLADCEIIYNERGSKVNFIFQGLPFLQMDILMTELGNLIIELSKSDLIIASKWSDDRVVHYRVVIGGKERWEKRKGKIEKAVGKGRTGYFRYVCNRSWNCFRGVVEDATSYGDKQSAVSSQIELADLKARFCIAEI